MNTLIGQHFTWGPSIEEGEGVWSNADRGRGKEPCGRPQVGTFLVFQHALQTLSMGDAY